MTKAEQKDLAVGICESLTKHIVELCDKLPDNWDGFTAGKLSEGS